MPRRETFDDWFDRQDENELIEWNDEELEDLYELLEDFPEFDDYLEDIFSLDDEDFYEGGK